MYYTYKEISCAEPVLPLAWSWIWIIEWELDILIIYLISIKKCLFPNVVRQYYSGSYFHIRYSCERPRWWTCIWKCLTWHGKNTPDTFYVLHYWQLSQACLQNDNKPVCLYLAVVKASPRHLEFNTTPPWRIKYSHTMVIFWLLPRSRYTRTYCHISINKYLSEQQTFHTTGVSVFWQVWFSSEDTELRCNLEI